MVARAVERHRRVAQPSQRVAERRAVRVADGEVVETGRARRRWTAALALPGIQPDVVVVPAGTQEGGRRSHPLRQLEPKDAGIERERAIQIRNLEMDVPDVRS